MMDYNEGYDDGYEDCASGKSYNHGSDTSDEYQRGYEDGYEAAQDDGYGP